MTHDGKQDNFIIVTYQRIPLFHFRDHSTYPHLLTLQHSNTKLFWFNASQLMNGICSNKLFQYLLCLSFSSKSITCSHLPNLDLKWNHPLHSCLKRRYTQEEAYRMRRGIQVLSSCLLLSAFLLWKVSVPGALTKPGPSASFPQGPSDCPPLLGKKGTDSKQNTVPGTRFVEVSVLPYPPKKQLKNETEI